MAVTYANHDKSYQHEYSKKSNEEYRVQPNPYKFEYQNRDEDGAVQFRKEISNGNGRVEGQYGYKDSYGIERTVTYIADEYGYRAQISTNEPGTENKSPAAVDLSASPVYVQYQPSQSKYNAHNSNQRPQQQSLPASQQRFSQNFVSQSSVKSHDDARPKVSVDNAYKVQQAAPVEYVRQQFEVPKIQQAAPVEFVPQHYPFRQVVPVIYSSQKAQVQQAVPQRPVIENVQSKKIPQVAQAPKQIFFSQAKSSHQFSRKGY
ncbi:Cuticle protein 10.9, partial [Stegodyphus mimosarum]